MRPARVVLICSRTPCGDNEDNSYNPSTFHKVATERRRAYILGCAVMSSLYSLVFALVKNKGRYHNQTLINVKECDFEDLTKMANLIATKQITFSEKCYLEHPYNKQGPNKLTKQHVCSLFCSLDIRRVLEYRINDNFFLSGQLIVNISCHNIESRINPSYKNHHE